ncbi:MAG: permease, partial [Moorellales bacterium]
TALRFFVMISLELVVLFVGITFLVSLILQYVSPERIQRVLAGKKLGLGNVIAAAFGGVTPFCSCSAVPILMGLLELGVPFGVAMSFLVASPLGVFNPVVLSLFGALLGRRVLVLYVISTFIAAVLAGMLLNALGLGRYVKKVRIIAALNNAGQTGPLTAKERARVAAQNAIGLFLQMLPYLLVGVAIGAFIYGFVPASFLARIAGPGNPLAVPVAAAIGVPLYVRTETIIPIGFALIKKGVSVGAIMALTIGGAGASIPELSMLAGVFKRRLWFAYILTMFAIATLIGYLFNFILSV